MERNNIKGDRIQIISCLLGRIGVKPAICCLLLFVGSFEVTALAPTDSVRLETINGKKFIIHQVDPKETLYAISRKYNVPVATLLEHNPKADAGLAVGQEIKIPYFPKAATEKESDTHKVAPRETLFSISKQYGVSVDDLKSWNNLQGNAIDIGQELIVKKNTVAVATPRVPARPMLRGVHAVTENETLFSISKMYGASVAQLKEWNSLTSDEVKPGQTLFVLPPMSIPEKSQSNKVTVATGKPIQRTGPTEIKISESVAGGDEIHEKGKAELMEGTEGNRKYLAQHKTARVGTIMKVRSDETKREIFVRVIGALATEDDSLIKISKSACDKLGMVDEKFNVELIYYK